MTSYEHYAKRLDFVFTKGTQFLHLFRNVCLGGSVFIIISEAFLFNFKTMHFYQVLGLCAFHALVLAGIYFSPVGQKIKKTILKIFRLDKALKTKLCHEQTVIEVCAQLE